VNRRGAGLRQRAHRAGKVYAFIATLLLTVFTAADARAIDDPSLTWWTYETEHFRVTYPHTLEPIAERVAFLCESIYGRLTAQMQYRPASKTEIILTDDTDSANGSASPIPYDAIRLFVTAPDDLSTLGDYDDWLLGLITHEYTHILHTGNISGLAAVANAAIGRTLSPNSAQPRWIIEGLAVVLESEFSTGGRIRSSLFDMYLRADVLADNVARIDQISAGAERWPYGNLYYLYGSRFLRWITDIYGPETMPAVSADYGAATIPFGINRALRRVTGRTYEELYDAWGEHLKRHYGKQIAEVDKRGRREGVRITFGGREAQYPRFVPAKLRKESGKDEIVYYRNDFNHTTGLYRFALGDPAVAGERDADLVIRTATETHAGFTPEGDILFSDAGYWKNLYSRHDLYVVPSGESSTLGTEPSRRRLTHGLRAHHPDVSPDGRRVTFTVNSKGTTSLMIADRSAEGAIERARVLVRGQPYEQAYTPRFSPDGRQIAYSSWSRGGYRDVRIVDVATGAVRDLTRDRSLDLEPCWSPDGGAVYFSSDRTGIFNVYVIDLASGDTKLVTNVAAGAFAPAVSSDGSALVYLGYTSEGYDIFSMKLDPARFLSAPAAPADRAEPYPEPARVKLEKSRYNPLATLRPHSYFLNIGPGNYSSTAVTFTASGSDLVGHHSIGAAIRFDPGAPEPRVDLEYGYGGFPVDLGAGFTRQVVPRTRGFSVGGKDVPFDETLTTFTTTVSAPLQDSFVSQSVALGYTATLFHGSLKLPTSLDPFGPVTQLPAEGFLSELRLTYGLAATEDGADTAGTRSGFAFRVGLSYADQAIGSDLSLYQFDASASAYVPMPWPGHQTIALRAAGAVAAGDRARGSLFFAGGYDFVNNGPLDTLVSRVYDGAFVLRGYPGGSFAGNQYLLTTVEYRAPIYKVNWGPGTVPIFLRRIDAAAFADWGGAFDDFDFDRLRLFHDTQLIYTPQMHSSVGLELWLGLTLAHRVQSDFRLGYAYGFSEQALKNGQFYFIGSSAF